MADRKLIPREVELSVLDRSRRRCAFCFHLHGDLTEKHGQLAHLDKDPGNPAEDNLAFLCAFLCMVHHSLFDSRTSQHKNYTLAEAKHARDQLYQAIALNKHLNSGTSAMGVETDRAILRNLMGTISGVMAYLRELSFAGISFTRMEFNGLDLFVGQSKGPEHEFINQELETLRKHLAQDGQDFLTVLAHETFRVPHDSGFYSVPQEWEDEDPQRFWKAVDSINAAAGKLCQSYDQLVRTARAMLAP